MFKLLLFFIQLAIYGLQAEFIERPIVVIVPSYNNYKWCNSNIDSVLNQNYNNYRVIYINDCSSDETGEVTSQKALAISKQF